MGKTPGEIEGEIDELRRETSIIVDELERRINPVGLAQGAAGAVAGRASTALDEALSGAPEVVRYHRPMVGSAVLSLLLGLGIFSLSTGRLGVRGLAAERELDRSPTLDGAVRQIGESVDEALERALARAKKARRERIGEGRRPRWLKRMLWVALAGSVAALGSLLFKRLSV